MSDVWATILQTVGSAGIIAAIALALRVQVHLARLELRVTELESKREKDKGALQDTVGEFRQLIKELFEKVNEVREDVAFLRGQHHENEERRS